MSSYFLKERQGTAIGDPGKQERKRGETKERIKGDKNFKNSSKVPALNGLPNLDSDFPKAGRGPEWKMLRESDISKGSI